MDAFEIRSLLEQLGFVEYWHEGNYAREKVKALGFVNQKYGVVYLKSNSDEQFSPVAKAPLVIHADFEDRLNALKETGSNISWVNSARLYFNSNLRGYPSKVNPNHTGKIPKPEKFGMALDIKNKTELDNLLSWMLGQTSPSGVKIGEGAISANGDSITFENLTHIKDDLINATIKTRRGQPAFRGALLELFNRTCCVTGCKVEALLEAAHIIPHRTETNYDVFNGLLLRADIHTLFDLGLLRITADGVVHMDSSLKYSEYFEYEGRKILENALPKQLAENLGMRLKI